ncbi:PDZ domain-containing protein [Buchananella felis]|uniref:YlbL family protein n=1 Tax=Buchananella felis TaxID=3231492 RepID=UPI0035276FB0
MNNPSMPGTGPQGGQENQTPPRWGDRPVAIGFQSGTANPAGPFGSATATPAGPFGPNQQAPFAPGQPRQVPGGKRKRGRAGKLTAFLVTVVVLGAAALGVSALRAPYVLEGPGPTLDVLGEANGGPVLAIDGLPTYDTSGELRMTTVSVRGGPGYHVTYWEVVRAWLDPEWDVVREEEVYPPGTTQQQVDQQGAAQMVTSQENAMARALTEIGQQVPAQLTTVGVGQGSDAEGKLEEGDVLTFISAPGRERVALEFYDSIHSFLSDTEPGTEVTLEYLRDGKPGQAKIVTRAPVNGYTGGPLLGASGSRLGIYLSVDMDLPFDVAISVDGISGPSAGLMFTLALIDKLTPGELTGGANVAGTGTLGMDATVGPIGGAPMKLAGAKRDGAEYFLLPVDNCADVTGRSPEGIQVVAVASLSEARQALEQIAAGQNGQLQTCEQATARLESQQ